jgi:tetratricopeptide (TPR) repeat protein
VASLLGRGDVWLKLGETAKARLDYDAALELYPTSSEGHLNRGILRALEGEWDSAVEDIELAVTLNKQNRSPFSRNLSVALADLDEYILNNPTKANGLIVRGIIKLFIEKFDEADVDFGKAFELNQSLKIDLEPGLKNLRKVLEENRKNQN